MSREGKEALVRALRMALEDPKAFSEERKRLTRNVDEFLRAAAQSKMLKQYAINAVVDLARRKLGVE